MKTTDQLEPNIFVIFGGAGDLTWRKLMPALFDLSQRSRVFRLILRSSRWIESNSAMDGLRKRLHEGVRKFARSGKAPAKEWNEFCPAYPLLSRAISRATRPIRNSANNARSLEKEWGSKAHRIFYMATPPSLFGEIPSFLGNAGLSADRERARIVIEKPIGYDLESARALNRILASELSRIPDLPHRPLSGQGDGAEHPGVPFCQSAVRADLEPALRGLCDHHRGRRGGGGTSRRLLRWSRRAARHGAESPAATALSGGHGTDGLLRCRRDSQQESGCAARGSSDPARRGASLPRCAGSTARVGSAARKCAPIAKKTAYRPIPRRRRLRRCRLFVDNWRWQDVPFYLRTGKRLPRQASEIAIQFRAVPHQSFPTEATLDWQPSRLVMSIQPDEGIVLRFQAKHPGPEDACCSQWT